MTTETDIKAKLLDAGVSPTRQRLALAAMIFGGQDRHFNADELFSQAVRAGCDVSLATLYNTLKIFCDTGLLREVIADSARAYYDTNATRHHHFYAPEAGMLTDIGEHDLIVTKLPTPPEGMVITGYEVMIHVVKR